MSFIAERQLHAYFASISYEFILANINKKLTLS